MAVAAAAVAAAMVVAGWWAVSTGVREAVVGALGRPGGVLLGDEAHQASAASGAHGPQRDVDVDG